MTKLIQVAFLVAGVSAAAAFHPQAIVTPRRNAEGRCCQSSSPPIPMVYPRRAIVAIPRAVPVIALDVLQAVALGLTATGLTITGLTLTVLLGSAEFMLPLHQRWHELFGSGTAADELIDTESTHIAR